MRKLALVLVCFLLGTSHLWAQSRTLTGKIVDDKGSPVSNASIVVKGTTIGTTSDATGAFRITVPPTAKVLVVTSLNFERQEITIGSTTNFAISLKPATSDLDEVVVTTYGTAKKRSEVSGSVVTVSSKQIENKPNANVLDALQGNAPGIQVYSNGGEPTMPQSVRINGVGSLGASSTPLYIMDGVPIDPGTVLSLNPNDFESVTVLRDASATSIYGARAANGVIVFTSKKGKANKFEINLSTQYGWSNLLKTTTDVYNTFMNTQQLEAFQLDFGLYTQAQIDARHLAGYTADTKWYKVYFKENQPFVQTDLNLSGGTGKTTYYIAGSYLSQEGLAYRSGYKRYSLRTNLNTVLNNWFQVGMNLFGSYDERQQNGYFENQFTSQGGNSLSGGLAMLRQPYYSPVDANGVRYNFIPGMNAYHPAYFAEVNPNKSNNLQINPSAYIQVNPVKNVSIISRAGLEFYDYRSSGLVLPSYLGSVGNGSASESFSRGATGTFTNTADYRFKVAGRHSFSVLLGQEFIKSKTTSFSGSSTGQADDRLILLSNGTANITASSSKTDYAYSSLFGRLSYNLDSKYFVDISVRNDNSSRFGRELRGATFYSVGGMWQAKKEKFLDNVGWISDLVVRASIGTSGNSSIGNYQSLGVVTSSVAAAYNAGNGYTIASPGNPKLSWEKQRQINIGFTATLWKKLNLEAEYFNRKTSSMLMDIPFPYTSGFSSITSNVGSLVNRGVNVKVSYDVVRERNSYLTVYANLGYVKDKITELFQGKDSWYIDGTGVVWVVGQPQSMMQPIFSHIDPATGNPLWFVPGPNKNILNKDPKNLTSNFNENALNQNTGLPLNAPFNGGFGLMAGYHGFSITAHFAFSSGKYIINNDRYFYENPTSFGTYNQSSVVTDYWKKPGDVTRFPRKGVQFTQFDTRLIEDASFTRLKNLTLQYDFPKSLLQKTHVLSGVSFYVTLRNILTFTNYQGPDPEVDTNLTYGANPNTRQTVVGVNIKF